MLKEKFTEVAGVVEDKDPYRLGEINDSELKTLLVKFDKSTTTPHFTKKNIRAVVTRLIPGATSGSFDYYLYKSTVISDAEPDEEVNKKTLSYSKGQVLAVLALLCVRQRMGGRRVNRDKDGIVKWVMDAIGQDHPLLQFFSKAGSGGLRPREKNWDEIIEEEVDKKQGRKDEGFIGFPERDATFLRKIDEERIKGWLSNIRSNIRSVEAKDILSWQRLGQCGIHVEDSELVERALLLIYNDTAKINAMGKLGANYEEEYRKIAGMDTLGRFIECLNLVNGCFERYHLYIKDLHQLALRVNEVAERKYTSVFGKATLTIAPTGHH